MVNVKAGVLCAVFFLAGIGVGSVSIYSLFCRQAEILDTIVGTQQLQIHYMIHTKENPNPFCSTCRHLGWTSDADL